MGTTVTSITSTLGFSELRGPGSPYSFSCKEAGTPQITHGFGVDAYCTGGGAQSRTLRKLRSKPLFLRPEPAQAWTCPSHGRGLLPGRVWPVAFQLGDTVIADGDDWSSRVPALTRVSLGTKQPHRREPDKHGPGCPVACAPALTGSEATSCRASGLARPPREAALPTGLRGCGHGPGIRHGSEPGSRDKDQVSALGAGLGPQHKPGCSPKWHVFPSKPGFRGGEMSDGQTGTVIWRLGWGRARGPAACAPPGSAVTSWGRPLP